MPRAYYISLIIIVLLVAGIARRGAYTSVELMPVSSAVNWVEGRGRALEPDLIGSGIKPAGTVRVGKSVLPAAPPVMMAVDGAVVRLFKDMSGGTLDKKDLPWLFWTINFAGTLPWALLLFGGLYRLSKQFGDLSGSIWPSWAAIAGTMAFGWFGVASVYLPVAALGIWTVALVVESRESQKSYLPVLAGICAGLAGAWHPSGWIWVIWGVFLLFVASSPEKSQSRQNQSILSFSASAIGVILLSLGANILFFGKPLPIQWIDSQPINFDIGRYGFLLWHDIAGLNGLIWLAPLALTGVFALLGGFDRRSKAAESTEEGEKEESEAGAPFDSILKFLVALAAVTLFIWGIADDSAAISRVESIKPELRMAPVEFADGRFSMVIMEASFRTAEEEKEYIERLLDRTEVFLDYGGRGAGMPVFLPAALLLGLMGWIYASRSGRWLGWIWWGVRWAGFIGLVVSQAPYGSLSPGVLYIGFGLPSGNMPVVEAILAVAIRLAELWPSGVVNN